MRKNTDELKHLKESLTNRLEILTKQSSRRNPTQEALEEAKWTGKKPKNLSEHEFDRLQRDESR